ncbi:hypothetical protein H7J50_01840 [Mycobacterium intermedium]|nr:hypothetical protein [Mycobacterium intermedium]ODR02334.1 hypothetical protein BHQ20_04395 [Mycobacterium intermedium]OPE52834.1 hypothetical protein BV508_00980 [Mycobacterium intermedium]
MRWWSHRVAVAVAAAIAPMAVVTSVTPAVSSARDCDPNMSFNYATGECKLAPPMPEWYHLPPTWAPPYAPPDVAPRPPSPSWAPTLDPVWDPRSGGWGVWVGPVWVPV